MPSRLARITVLALLLALFHVPVAAPFVGVTPELAERMEAMEPGDRLRVNVILKAQHDISGLAAETAALGIRARRKVMWEAIEVRVATTQVPVRRVLDELIDRGEADDPRTLYSANGITVSLTRAAIEELASLPEVRSLDWDEERPLTEVIDEAIDGDREVAGASPLTTIMWHVERVRAPEMWQLGFTGEGILIGVIDTGVNYNHLDLRDHMWDGGAQYPNHGWDFIDNDDDPIDEGHSGGHGTSVAGLCCGDGTAGFATGVAPDATVMAIRCSGFTSSESVIWQGQDFALQQGCDVITMSLSWKHHFIPDYATWRSQEDMIHAAGIAHSQSAGNLNGNPCCPLPWNVSAPGNTPPPWLHPDQTLIGGVSGVTAVGNVDSDDVIAISSSRGPSSWETIPEYGDYPYDPQMGLLKPDVVAPGSGTTSLRWDVDDGYSNFAGTSAAAPHVGGAYGLLRQARPELSVAQLSEMIQFGAVDLGEPGKDNVYGAGRLDVRAAYDLAPQFTLAPPTDLEASDTPMDHGGSIDLTWTLSIDEGGGEGPVEQYRIYRTTVPGSYISSPVGIVPAGIPSYQDTTTTDFVSYYYIVVAAGSGAISAPSNEVGPVSSMPNLPAALHGPADAPASGPLLRIAGPNPFSEAAALRLVVPEAGRVKLAVYTVAGELVRVLEEGRVPAGEREITWNGRDSRGHPAAGGVYLVRLSGNGWSASEKLLKLD